MTEVLMNGKFVGHVENAQNFVQQIRAQRRSGSLDSNLNIAYHPAYSQVSIETEKGRLRRPLIVVQNGQSLFTEKQVKHMQKKVIKWNDLISQGIIEYLDAEEEENAYVSFFEHELTADHTHLEITPLAMLGLCTTLVPFGNYTQSARLSIGSKNQKQALGFYAANFGVRMDMDVNLLHTPQLPIVTTIMHDISHYETHPSGQNIVVAVMVHKGYNMDDAIVLNKASIERGMGRSSYYRPCVAEELRYSGGLMDEISIPDKEAKGY
ncbi:MAG: DNA-directed RNA polymerase subunit B, partial [Candidatus Woesearchaeota archaeon]|nr:DNA-directed RNA polymerase subunit B [Candidatus Woesearchaeota archaeon]